MITSVSNKLIKFAASLNQKKYRQQYGLFLLDGCRAVNDAYLNNPDTISHIFMTDTFFASAVKENLFKSLIDNTENAEGEGDGNSLKVAGQYKTNKQYNCIGSEQTELIQTEFAGIFGQECKLVLVSNNIMQKISDTTTPSGITAIAKVPKENENLGEHVIYLDRIHDPGNLGSIIRSALAAGYDVVLDNCADIFSPKTVRSSMSAILKIKFSTAKEDTLTQLKSKGYNIIGADAAGENLFVSKISAPLCVVIGNEAEGISPKILAHCNKILSIPMESIESLNASVAAAIMMYNLKYN